MSGFAESLVEDWVTKADERSLQVPLAYCLMYQGYTVKYFSQHSADELGKDLVAFDSKGNTHCFQLKVGNVGSSDWNNSVRRELLQAAELPAILPGSVKKLPLMAYLVTSGRITDPIKRDIDDLNSVVPRLRAQIKVVQRDELVKWVLDAFQRFLPPTVKGVSDLLRLHVRNGREPLECATVEALLRAAVFSVGQERKSRRPRAHIDCALTVAFLTAPHEREENHLAIIDAWTLLATKYLEALAEGVLDEAETSAGLAIAHAGLRRAQIRFVQELEGRDDWFEAGALSEGLVYHYRRCIVMGYISATFLSLTANGEDATRVRGLLRRCWETERPIASWGEGAWNYILNTAVALSAMPDTAWDAEALIAGWIDFAVRDVPDPYVTVADVLREQARKGHAPKGAGASYTVAPATLFLARRLRRQAIGQRWREISRCHHIGLIHDRRAGFFRWRNDSAAIVQSHFPAHGSWSTLRSESQRPIDALFEPDQKWLLPHFLCTYPHRIGYRLSTELQDLAGI